MAMIHGIPQGTLFGPGVFNLHRTVNPPVRPNPPPSKVEDILDSPNRSLESNRFTVTVNETCK